MFVAVDGPNGVGKTTVCEALGDRLRAEGCDVLAVRQPSDSDVGRFAREQDSLRGVSLATLVVGDRYFQVETVIKPALAAGRWVVSDRFVPSTLVLQRIDGLELDFLWRLNSEVLVPDLTVFLGAEPATIEARLDARGRVSRFDRLQDIAEQESRLYGEAAELLKAKGHRVIEIDTEISSVKEIAHAIQAALHGLADSS